MKFKDDILTDAPLIHLAGEKWHLFCGFSSEGVLSTQCGEHWRPNDPTASISRVQLARMSRVGHVCERCLAIAKMLANDEH